jgi:hypothetical protein
MDVVVMPEPRANVERLVSHAKAILESDAPMRRSSGDSSIRFGWGGHGIAIPLTINEMDDYSTTSDERVEAVMRTVLGSLMGEIQGRTPERLTARRDALRNALTAQFLTDIQSFIGSGVAKAESASTRCATPWSRRIVSLNQMETPPLTMRSISRGLPAAPTIPIACEAGMDFHENGSAWISLSAFKVDIADPWNIDVVEAMRRFMNARDPWDRDVAG